MLSASSPTNCGNRTVGPREGIWTIGYLPREGCRMRRGAHRQPSGLNRPKEAKLAVWSRSYVESDDPSLQALESRVSILHPLIHFLTENGISADILDVLGAWYTPLGRRECDDRVLVIAAGHPPGVRYLWPGGMLQVDKPKSTRLSAGC